MLVVLAILLEEGLTDIRLMVLKQTWVLCSGIQYDQY